MLSQLKADGCVRPSASCPEPEIRKVHDVERLLDEAGIAPGARLVRVAAPTDPAPAESIYIVVDLVDLCLQGYVAGRVEATTWRVSGPTESGCERQP